MKLWNNEEMQHNADKYSIEELDNLYNKFHIGSGGSHGAIDGCPESFYY